MGWFFLNISSKENAVSNNLDFMVLCWGVFKLVVLMSWEHNSKEAIYNLHIPNLGGSRNCKPLHKTDFLALVKIWLEKLWITSSGSCETSATKELESLQNVLS